MIYHEIFDCTAEKSRVLVKEKGKKFFSYKSVEKLIVLLENKKELYSMDTNTKDEKILKIEYFGLQDFIELKTFSGSKILLGKNTEIFVDGVWVQAMDILFHEKIYEYDFLKDHFKDTFITDIKNHSKLKAYKIFTENNNGLVINNFLVRFYTE